MTDAPAGGEGGRRGGGGGGGRGSQQVRLLPVTCKQVAAAVADGEVFRIDGQETSHVTLVGQLCLCVQQANYILVTLDDGTGLAEVQYWIDAAAPAAAQIKELCSGNNYLRIFGNLREFQGRKDILAQRIQAVNNFDEVTFHMLQCVATHLANTRGPLTPSVPARYGAAQAAGTGADTGAVGSDGTAYPSNVHHMVHEIVRADHSTNGIAISEICAKLAGTATEAKINEAIDYFMSQGIFWHGVDRGYVKCN